MNKAKIDVVITKGFNGGLAEYNLKVKERCSGVILAESVLTPEEFAGMITGQVVTPKVEALYGRTDRMGKTRKTKTVEFQMMPGEELSEARKRAKNFYESKGMDIRAADIGNGHRRIKQNVYELTVWWWE